MNFQAGDVVRYVDSTQIAQNEPIEMGQTYTVASCSDSKVSFQEFSIPYTWHSWRFELVYPAASSKEYEELFL